MGADAGGERCLLHQAGDMLVGKPLDVDGLVVLEDVRNREPLAMRPKRIQVLIAATGQERSLKRRPTGPRASRSFRSVTSTPLSAKLSIQPSPLLLSSRTTSRPTVFERRRPPAKPRGRIWRSRRPLRSWPSDDDHRDGVVANDRLPSAVAA